jgi:hypothetical protein
LNKIGIKPEDIQIDEAFYYIDQHNRDMKKLEKMGK